MIGSKYVCPAPRCKRGSKNKNGIKKHVWIGHVEADFKGNEYPDWDEYFLSRFELNDVSETEVEGINHKSAMDW
jgi:hypothetical protein